MKSVSSGSAFASVACQHRLNPISKTLRFFYSLRFVQKWHRTESEITDLNQSVRPFDGPVKKISSRGFQR
jgi:hypothetical protein